MGSYEGVNKPRVFFSNTWGINIKFCDVIFLQYYIQCLSKRLVRCLVGFGEGEKNGCGYFWLWCLNCRDGPDGNTAPAVPVNVSNIVSVGTELFRWGRSCIGLCWGSLHWYTLVLCLSLEHTKCKLTCCCVLVALLSAYLLVHCLFGGWSNLYFGSEKSALVCFVTSYSYTSRAWSKKAFAANETLS